MPMFLHGPVTCFCSRGLTQAGEYLRYGFVFSDEYKNKNAKDDTFVEMLYNVFMDKKSDPSGKEHWVGLLKKGYSRRYVYRKFAHSQEFSDICKDYKITRGVITLDSERDR